MYLSVLEDGSLYKGDGVLHSEYDMADVGILSIVDMPTGEEYHNGAWVEIEEIVR